MYTHRFPAPDGFGHDDDDDDDDGDDTRPRPNLSKPTHTGIGSAERMKTSCLDRRFSCVYSCIRPNIGPRTGTLLVVASCNDHDIVIVTSDIID